MPVGEQAAGGSLGTIFYPARPTARCASGQLWHLIPRFLSGRGLSSHRDLPVPNILVWRSRSCFDTKLVAPEKFCLARSEAGEITAAGRAAVGPGAEAQQKPRPPWRIIEVLIPFGQFLPVAAGTTCVPPGPVGPDTGFPAVVAAAAAQARNSHHVLQELGQSQRTGDAHVPCPAVWTGELHGLILSEGS